MNRHRGLQVVPASLERRIHLIRGERGMLDADLALLYGVQPKRLNEQVKRNRRRFPADFMFRLTAAEARALRSQIATLDNSKRRGRHRKYAPYVFTEHGVVMLAAVINSDIAVKVSLQVVRAFVRLRAAIGAHAELTRKLERLKRKYDGQFGEIIDAIHQLVKPPLKARRPIGFRTPVDRELPRPNGRLQFRARRRSL